MSWVLRVALAGAMVLGAVAASSAAPAAAPDRAAVVKRSKAASAYLFVNVGNDREMASAFCIDSGGIFVTCKHVIDEADGAAKFSLVLNSGEVHEHTITAHVLRVNDDCDLAILKADQSGPYDALNLGDSDALIETDDVIAFGFPFGEGLSAEGQNPGITVSRGHVTSLRKEKGELVQLQLDASLNPGNSGGPIVDSNGDVVGVVSGGIPGAALNFATPSSKLKAMLSKPLLSLSPTTLPYDLRTRSTVFTIHVDLLVRETRKLEVTLSLGKADTARTFTASLQGDGGYAVNAIPFPPESGPVRLAINAQFKNGSVSGETSDRDITAGSSPLHLRDLQSIDPAKGNAVYLDGKTTSGPLSGLDKLDVDLGGDHATLDMSHAIKIELRSLATPVDQLPYRVTVRVGTEMLTELSGVIPLVGRPHSGEAPLAVTTPPADAPNSSGTASSASHQAATDTLQVRIPGTIDDVRAGASGRMLIFHLAGLHQLVLFDTQACKVVKFIPIPTDNFFYAAGEHSLVVVRPDDGIAERYDLATGNKDLTAKLPPGAPPTAIAAGCASDGPICMYGETWSFLSMQTLGSLPIVQEGPNNRGVDNGVLNIRAAADGSAFAAWNPEVRPSGVRLLNIEGDHFIYRFEPAAEGLIFPSYDGTQLYMGKEIVKAGNVGKTGRDLVDQMPFSSWILPTYSPGYYVTIGLSPLAQRGTLHDDLTLYSAADHRALATIPDIDTTFVRSYPRTATDKMTPEKRLHVMPGRGIVVTIPDTDDCVILQHFSLPKLLDDTGIEYLFAESVPPHFLPRGKDLSYQISVRSKRGGVTFELQSGPDGMTVSPTGLVTWRRPKQFSDKSVSVIISIKDANGQEMFHTFTMTVE